MTHNSDDRTNTEPQERTSELPQWLVLPIVILSLGAVVFVVLAIAMSELSFLCIAAGMVGTMAFTTLTPDIQRARERAETGHEDAKLDFILLHRKRMAALALVAAMIGAILLTNLFPGMERAIVLASFVIGTMMVVRFKYPFGF